MAITNLSISFILTSFLLFSTAVPSRAVFPDDVYPKTRNSSLCSAIVKSAGTADLTKLAAFILNVAHSISTRTLRLVRSLATNAVDPKLKQRYASCSGNYDEAVADLEQAGKYLASGDYNGVNVKTSGVMTHVEDCRSNFERPPADPSALQKNGRSLEDVCSIVLVLSNRLLGGF